VLTVRKGQTMIEREQLTGERLLPTALYDNT